jgi:hypothetical protein
MPAATISETQAPASSVDGNVAKNVRVSSGERIARGRTDFDDRAVREDDRRGDDVIDGESVLETMGAARILRDVAADRADALRTRIRRVVISLRRDRTRDVQIDHARLHAHPAVLQIDREDAVHARQHDEQASGHGQRAARESRAGTSRNDRHPVPPRHAHDARNFLGRLGQDHRQRPHARARQAVALVGPQIRRIDDATPLADDLGEVGSDRLQRDWDFRSLHHERF